MIYKPALTIADIAKLADVSKSTVSRALNDSPLIGVETKERIKEIAEAHNFRINGPARQLSLKHSRTIGFVTHCFKKDYSVSDLFSLEIMGGILIGLAESGYDMLVINVNPHEIELACQYFNSGKVDGLVLVTSMRKQHHIQTLSELNVPFITWGLSKPNIHCCSVTGDNFRGGKQAASHLLASGKQNIAFLGGPADDPEVNQRYAGYEAAIKSAGKTVNPFMVVNGDYSESSGIAAMEQLLKEAPQMDAVFINSDLMAIAAMDVIREHGLRVPEDIAVIGYDDLSIAEHSYPKLTTIRQNIPFAGKLLAKNLIQYLQTGIVTNVTIPVELIVRKSG